MTQPEDELIIDVGPPAPARGPTPDRPEITIRPDVAAWIEQFARTDTTRELAGVLLGDLASSRRGSKVAVKAAIEARFTRSDAASITFTHKTWEDVNAVREQRYPHLRIVGWFHTHPGLGVFLSRWDLFIHQHFFAEPWQVAFVVDPLARSSGFFRWEDGEVRRAGETAFRHQSAGGAPSLLRRCTPVVTGFAAGAASTALIFSVMHPAPAPRVLPAAVSPVPAAQVKARPGAAREHPVKRGDCLWRIAKEHYGDGWLAYRLAIANGIGNPNLLSVGKVLKVPERTDLPSMKSSDEEESPR